MKTLLRNAFFITLLVLVSACSSGTTTSSAPPNLSGASFSGTITPGTFNARSIQLTLIQGTTDTDSGDAVISGNFIVSDFIGCLEGGTVVGTITGTALTFTVSDSTGATISFTGTASNSSIDGTIVVSGASTTTCGTGNFSGSLNATR